MESVLRIESSLPRSQNQSRSQRTKLTQNPKVPTTNTTNQATNELYELRVVVLAEDVIDDVCDGNGGRIVAELGVGSEAVTDI